MKLRVWFGLLLSVLFIAGCRTVSYWAWEKVGVYKRDLLKKDVVAARDDELHAALKRAEGSMDPVLTHLHDQVLVLKHNLNAAAIASLKEESTNIQTDIGKLLDDMNAAIAQADKFINTLP